MRRLRLLYTVCFNTASNSFLFLSSSKFIDCNIELNPNPIYVSIIPSTISQAIGLEKIQIQPSNLIRIIYPPKLTPSNNTAVGLCVNPVHVKYKYDNFTSFQPLRLVEWFELQKLLGFTSITMYDMDKSIEKINPCLFKSYENLTTVFSLNSLADQLGKEYRLYAGTYALATINDCLFRYRRLVKYVVHYDFDESIIPNLDNVGNWIEFIEKIYDEESDKIYSYWFQNGFFFPKQGLNGEIVGQVNSRNHVVNKLLLTRRIHRNLVVQQHGFR